MPIGITLILIVYELKNSNLTHTYSTFYQMTDIIWFVKKYVFSDFVNLRYYEFVSIDIEANKELYYNYYIYSIKYWDMLTNWLQFLMCIKFPPIPWYELYKTISFIIIIIKMNHKCGDQVHSGPLPPSFTGYLCIDLNSLIIS